VGVLLADVERRVLVSYQRGLFEEVAQGVVVTRGADIAYVHPGLVGGPGRVHPGPPLAVGLGCVDGPKQLQPVALCPLCPLCLSRDGGPPLEFVRTYEHLTLPGEVSGWDPNFGERRKAEVGLLRINLPRTPVHRFLHCYSSPLENCSKASRAFEEFSRSGPCSPHAKHSTTQWPTSVTRTRSGVCGGQGFLLGGSEEARMRLSRLEKMEGSWPRSRRSAGGCPAPSREGTLSNSYCIMVSYPSPRRQRARGQRGKARTLE
jgi:hypothetical protein